MLHAALLLEWDTKLSDRNAKEIIKTQNLNKLLSVLEGEDSFSMEVHNFPRLFLK